VFAFAIDNFKRDPEEVEFLMNLAKDKLLELAQNNEFLQNHNIRAKVLGDLSLLKSDVRESMMEVMQLTEKNTSLLLNVCFAYDSVFEIDNAMKGFVQNELKEGEGSMDYRDMKERFEKYLLIGDRVDVIVRTSNEIRLSNFLVYQGTSSELCFLQENWPEVSIWSFVRIVLDYQRDEMANGEFRARLQQMEEKDFA